MSVPANQSLFDDPASFNRLIAIATGISDDRVRGGMYGITQDKLRPGELIFRVGHSTLPMTKNMSSPWWMRDESFYAILGASEASGTPLGELYRMKCAVSYDFGTADIVLQARVRQLLRVFAGHGRPVIDESSGRAGQVWFGALEIAQVFVPGLRDFKTGLPTPLCHAAIEIEEKFKVSEFRRVWRGRQRWFTKKMLREMA